MSAGHDLYVETCPDGGDLMEVLSLDWLLATLLSLVAYLLGAIPSAYVMVRLAKGVDIRQVGTRNVGALNTYQQVGLGGGLLVLLADAGKGALAVLLPHWVGAPEWTIYPAAALVLVGHNWPVFLGFRGGKGAATILGIALTLLPHLALIALAPALVVVILARNVVIGAMLGFVLFNVLTVVMGQDIKMTALFWLLTLLVVSTYLAGTLGHMLTALKARRWREAFYETGLKPED
jgi:glycerol-3-phosphate acyltransferase PlsY